MDYAKRLSEIFEIVKDQSIQSPDKNGNYLKWKYSKPANWDDLREKMMEDLVAAGPPTHEDFFASLDRFLARLGTRHSGVMGAEPYYARGLYLPNVSLGSSHHEDLINQEPWPVLKARRNRSDAMMKKLEAARSRQGSYNQRQPIFSLLANGQIAYLNLPGHVPSQDLPASIKYESILRDGLMQASRSGKLKGAIVDLRNNGGGGCGPMLRGLSPLLGDKPVGHFIDAKGQTSWTSDYAYKFHNSKAKPYAGKISNYPLKDLPVVTLIGESTASSGEITALSLITRPNSVTIGTPSNGATSGNLTYNELLPGTDALCYFTTSISTDHTKKHGWGYSIEPDIYSKTPVLDALKWLAPKMGIRQDFATLAARISVQKRQEVRRWMQAKL